MKHMKLTYSCNLCMPIKTLLLVSNVFLGKGGVMKYQSISNLSCCL